MKKLLFLILAIIPVMAFSQTAFITPANISLWGTAADTLIASKSDTVTFKVTSNYIGKMNLLMYTSKVSGAPAYTALLDGSINQASWVTLDTVTYAGGNSNYAYFAVQELIYNYYRIRITSTATAQKSRLYLYGLTRQ